MTRGNRSFPSIREQLADYWALMGGLRPLALAVFGISLLSGLFEALGIAAFTSLIDQEGLAPLFPWLGQWVSAHGLSLFLLFASLALVTGYLADELSWRFRTALECNLRLRVLNLFSAISWQRALATHSANIHQSFITEAYEIAMGAYSMVRAAVAGFTILGLLLIVACYSPLGTLSILSVSLFFGVAFVRFHRAGWIPLKEGTALLQENFKKIGSSWSSLKYSRSTEEISFLISKVEKEIDSAARVKLKNRLLYPRLALWVRLACLAAVAGALFLLTADGSLSLATWLVPIVITYRMIPHFVGMYSQVHNANTSYPWILSFKELQSKREELEDRSPVQPRSTFAQSLELRDVWFKYEGSRGWVFRSANLRLERGECAVVLGPSGAGKSTLVDLLSGLSRPDRGGIYLDGTACTLGRDWRRKLGVVFQDPLLFAGTLEENVCWSRCSDPQWLNEVGEMAGLAELVGALPQGWKTMLGDLGGGFSQGQKQRIAIARALYRRPGILILDEPTNALDEESLRALKKIIVNQKGRTTQIILTHDASLLEFATSVFRIEDGRTVILNGSDGVENGKEGLRENHLAPTL